MKMIKVAKDFQWEMSHRLPFHDGLCRNVHGHTYRIRVELEGEPTNDSMVLDYYIIKTIVKPMVEILDHTFICDKNDKLMIDFLKANGFKHYVINDYTTAENIALHLADIFSPEFKKYDNLHRLCLRVYETEDAYAELIVDLK